MKWSIRLALLGAMAGTPSYAFFTTGDALIIGNAHYGDVTAEFGPNQVQAAAKALRLRGQDVATLANGTVGPMTQALESFAASAAKDESPLIVVLSGIFADGPNGAHLLPAGGDVTSDAAGLPLAAVLDVLAQSPRRAFLVLGEVEPPLPSADAQKTVLDGMTIPDGVTVIRGPAQKVAQFAALEMAQPGERLVRSAAAYDLDLDGYTSDGLVVLEHTEVRPPTSAEISATKDRIAALDTQAWKTARDVNTAVAFQAYLNSYPDGLHADAASKMIAESDLGLDVPARKTIQRDLTTLGYNTRGIDGVFGPATRGAITAWQKRIGDEATGHLSKTQIARLSQEAAVQAKSQRQTVRTAVVQQKKPAKAAVSATETAIWNRARGERDLRNYLNQYPNGAYSSRARVLISNMQRNANQ